MNLQTKIEEWRSQDTAAAIAAVNQHLPFWVSALAVIMIAWYLVQIVWALVPEPAPAAPLAQRPSSAAEPAARSNAHVAIVDSHIFGESSADDTQAVTQSTANAPETKLNLELHGAIMSSDPDQAHAIISEQSKNSNVYFIGDAIPGGAKLHEVQATLVILSRGGVLETLRLPEVAKGGIVNSQTRSTTRRRTFIPARTARNLAEDGENITNKFTDIVRPQPYMPDGKLKGYRIYPGRDRKGFAALGLRPGDLVTDINGVALNNMADGMSLFQSLGDASQVTVTLERNGQPQVVSIDTSLVMNKDDTQR